MTDGKKILCLIPARGGSKRLPSKNIKPFLGEPLINWTIGEALKSDYLSRIVVSTDNDKIAEVALKRGAEVPFMRPKELSEDTSTSIEVVIHAIDYFAQKGEIFDSVMMLQPTSPLRQAIDINNSISLMVDAHLNSVVSVCETDHSPLWSNTLPGDLSMDNFINPGIRHLRSQDLPKYYRLNGAIYLSKIEFIYRNKYFIGNNTKAYIMPKERSIDIDSELDFLIAETIKQYYDNCR